MSLVEYVPMSPSRQPSSGSLFLEDEFGFPPRELDLELFSPASAPSTGSSLNVDRSWPDRPATVSERSFYNRKPFRKGSRDGDGRDERATIWTRPALFFISSIAAFVLVTVFLLAAAMRLQAIAVHSINADGMGNPTSISKSFFYPVYLLQAQSIVCEFILLGAAIFAVVTQNLISVVAVLLFNVYLVVTGFLEAGQRNFLLDIQGRQMRTVGVLLWVIPAVDVCLHIGTDWAAYRLYRELGWKAYKQSSADLALGKLHRRILILRATAFFTSVFVLLTLWTTLVLLLDWLAFLSLLPMPSIPEGGLRVLLPLIFGVIFFAAAMMCLYLGVKRESKRLVWGSVGCQVVVLGCHLAVVGKFAPLLGGIIGQIARHEHVSIGQAGALSNDWRCYFQYDLTTFLLLATLGMSVVVVRGFGKGMKEREIDVSHRPIDGGRVILD